MMKKVLCVLGLMGFMSISHAQILQIDFGAVYSHTASSGSAASPSQWRRVSGTMVYDTDALANNEEYTEDSEYWKWQYQTNQGVGFNITLSNPLALQEVTYDNVSDYLYGEVTSCTAFESVYGYLPGSGEFGYVDMKRDSFGLIYEDQSSHAGTINGIQVNFNNNVVWTDSSPLEAYAPQIAFNPDYFNPTPVSTYGDFSIYTVEYDGAGEVISGAWHYFTITSAEVTAIPEPATILSLGGGFLIIQRRRIRRARFRD